MHKVPHAHAHEQLLKEEMDRLCNYGVVRKINNSEWASPVFTVPKSDNTLRSIGDFMTSFQQERRGTDGTTDENDTSSL